MDGRQFVSMMFSAQVPIAIIGVGDFSREAGLVLSAHLICDASAVGEIGAQRGVGRNACSKRRCGSTCFLSVLNIVMDDLILSCEPRSSLRRRPLVGCNSWSVDPRRELDPPLVARLNRLLG